MNPLPQIQLLLVLAGALATPQADPAAVDSSLRIDSVVVSGPGVFHMGAAAARLKGQRLDSAVVHHQLEALVDSSVAQGFLMASAMAHSAEQDSNLILRLETTSGGRLIWQGLRDLGSSRLTPLALTRLARLPVGSPADPALLAAAQRRLVQTGYVAIVRPAAIRKVPRTARAEALVFLTDLPSSFVEAAATWSQHQAIQGFVEAHLTNLAGTARDLDFGIREGEAGVSSQIHWKEPWIASLEAQLEVGANLAYDSLSQVLGGTLDVVWPFWEDRLHVGGGLSMARRAERNPGDSLFGPVGREIGTRFTLGFERLPPSIWPLGARQANLSLEAVAIQSDTGQGVRIRSAAGLDSWWAAGPAAIRLGAKARGVWPLDQSVGLSEALAPGGINGWRGWPEGSPRTPAWAWLITQVGIGSPRWGGVFGFWEPGVRALRRPDQVWKPAWSWSAGFGMSLQLPAWLVDLAITAREDTRSAQDALLQVRVRNQF